MYRVVGVASKVTKLMTMGLDRRKADQINLEDNIEWETKTLTSSIKTFLRNLPGSYEEICHFYIFLTKHSFRAPAHLLFIYKVHRGRQM